MLILEARVVPKLPPEERPLITVEEAAALMCIGRTLAWELVASGELPVVRWGGKTLVNRQKLLAKIDQMTEGGE